MAPRDRGGKMPGNLWDKGIARRRIVLMRLRFLLQEYQRLAEELKQLRLIVAQQTEEL